MTPRIILSLLCVACAAEVVAGADAIKSDDLFVRKDTWAGTMLATRAKYVQRCAKQDTKGELMLLAWWPVAGAFPAECNRWNRGLGGIPDSPLWRWFRDPSRVDIETAAIGNGAGELDRQFGHFPQAAAYVRRALAELVAQRAGPEDPRWLELFRKTALYIEKLQPMKRYDFRGIRQTVPESLRVLASAVGNGQLHTDELSAAPADIENRLADLSARLDKGDESCLEGVPALAEQCAAFERNVLVAMPGVKEYVAACRGVKLADDWQQQALLLRDDLAKRDWFKAIAAETFNREAAILDTDRDPTDVVLRRASALLADLESMPKAPDCRGFQTQIGESVGKGRPAWEESSPRMRLKKQLADLRAMSGKVDPKFRVARSALLGAACMIRRQVAFSNPLLDFKDLLLLQRNGLGGGHMCDQYYGICQVPGGGLYVLSDPFSQAPRIRDVLGNSVVTNGRLKGRPLPKTGSFVTPALSFDGTRIAFAHVECEGDAGHREHLDPLRGHWSQGRSYHIFSAGIDGSDLRMVTDGTWNDFSPCFMPSGRMAFISERRGGYLRCGRVCPTYTLFDMAADGADIRCLSFHETNEWSPSVTHDGSIVWTRWDYVDRHGQTVHHPWLITPDGRNPRPIHGNYSIRSRRADMETDVRPIPGSPCFVATAAPHHGQSFGSLVIVDPNVQDDDAMAPVKRLTPEAGFPESQGGQLSYGHPWPLSETYYLCAYTMAGITPGDLFGIYLIDAFGNKELICRAPDIHCLSPIPVKPRPAPPVVPESSDRVAAGKPAEAVVGVVNVYNSLKAWPKDTRIKALRVYQVFPLSIPSDAVYSSHATGLQIPQGGDSVNLARAVLGTVPVEEDGSAYFIAPARKELYFQALDEHGLAVTSMRSGTQFQAGEHAMCQGCHEPKFRAPAAPANTTMLAMRRAPSRLAPDVDGTNPFSYPRLVQPVLDRNCLACHVKNAGQAPPLGREVAKSTVFGYMNPVTDYYTSYLSLAPKYGFYSYPDFYRSTPGQFGARASKLYEMLQKGHHGVSLSAEDFHRITVWLDSVSQFYGVYESEGGKAQLRGEVARPTLE